MARTSRKQQNLSLSQSFSEQTQLYNVAIYARLSVEDNGKDSDSIESQIEYLEDFIANDPTMRKVAVYIDNGFTGTNFMRPEFQRMIDAARLGDINCVVVKDLSRLGRNYVETGEFLEKVCPFIGLRFIAVNDNYDSEAVTNNSQLAASLSNIINDFYAKDISRKVFSALKTKMENGEYIGAWEKYGYLKDPDNKNRLIVNPETAPIVQQIFLWRSEGMSYMGINKKLNEMDIPSPGQYKADRGIVTNNNQKKRKILWNKHIVTDILKDITYIGHRVFSRGIKYIELPSIEDYCKMTLKSYSSSPFQSSKNVYFNGVLVEGTLVIPDTVTAIGPYAFAGLRTVDKIILPKGLTDIHETAFEGCEAEIVISE